MEPEEFIQLYEKYISGNCTPVEKEDLEACKDQFQLIDLQWNKKMGNREKIKHQILSQLYSHIMSGYQPTP